MEVKVNENGPKAHSNRGEVTPGKAYSKSTLTCLGFDQETFNTKIKMIPFLFLASKTNVDF